jgi:ABC-type nickel/cobalt efflux system permease component RcnA
MRLRAIAVIVVFVAALLGIILLLLLTEMPHLFGAWGQLVTEMQAVQRALHRGLADAVRAVEQQGWVAAWSLISLSFLYGVFHAAGPGHGKLIIATYLATHESRLKRGIALAIWSALAQGVTAVIAVEATVAILGLSLADATKTALQLERVSYALVALLGMFLMIAAARRLWSGHHHHHHGHAHMPSPSDIPDEITLRQMLSIILSIGIRPCAGAVLVLIFAYILQLRWTGISAVFAMSIGTAITVAGLAALSVYARQVALRLSSRIPEGSARVAALFNIAALLGGLILVLLGVALFKSLQAVAGHPIL